MKILITGATGFLGRFLCQALQKQGHDLTALSSKLCDLRNDGPIYQIPGKFDQIYHLAAWTQAGDFPLRHPGEQWLYNQAINTHVLTWWQDAQPQAKMICIGTSCSYDENLPLTEEMYLQGVPIPSLYSYAMTKRMLLIGLMALHKQFDLNYLYVIPSTLYGPYYHSDGRQLHFIFDLIRKILRGVLYDEEVVLWGDGEQKRELIHVEDFVNTLIKLNQKEKNTHFNVGAGVELSIKDFARKICNITGYPFEKICFDTSRYVGARSKVLKIQKLKESIPEFRLLDLDVGLQQTINWFLSEKENLLPPIPELNQV